MDYYKRMFPRNKTVELFKTIVCALAIINIALLYSLLFTVQDKIELLQDKTAEMEMRINALENSVVLCLDEPFKQD